MRAFLTSPLSNLGGWDRSEVADPMHRMREVAHDMNVPSPPSTEIMLRWLLTQPLQFTPGERCTYHNLNYFLLGRIVEKITATRYEEFVQTNVFAPLGITGPRTGKTKAENRAEGEVAYYIAATGPSIFDDDPGIISQAYGGSGGHIPTKDASGGWIASIIDLARFVLAVDGDPNTPEFLSGDMQDYMLQPTGSVAYGRRLDSDIPTAHYHNGLLNGSISLLSIQNDGTILVALINTSNVNINIFTLFPETVNAVRNWPAHDLFEVYE